MHHGLDRNGDGRLEEPCQDALINWMESEQTRREGIRDRWIKICHNSALAASFFCKNVAQGTCLIFGGRKRILFKCRLDFPPRCTTFCYCLLAWKFQDEKGKQFLFVLISLSSWLLSVIPLSGLNKYPGFCCINLDNCNKSDRLICLDNQKVGDYHSYLQCLRAIWQQGTAL